MDKIIARPDQVKSLFMAQSRPRRYITYVGGDLDERVYADGGRSFVPGPLLYIILTALAHDIILPHKIGFLCLSKNTKTTNIERIIGKSESSILELPILTGWHQPLQRQRHSPRRHLSRSRPPSSPDFNHMPTFSLTSHPRHRANSPQSEPMAVLLHSSVSHLQTQAR